MMVLGVMEGTSGTEYVVEPQLAVGLVLASAASYDVHTLLSRLEPEVVSVVVWQPECGPQLEREAASAQVDRSRFFFQTLADGDRLEAGVLYLAPAQSQIWFEGQRARVAAAADGHGDVDRFLETLAESWGQRCVAVIPSSAENEANRGVLAVRAAGGVVLEPGMTGSELGRHELPRSVRAQSDIRELLFANRPLLGRPLRASRRAHRLAPLSPAMLAKARAAAAATVERARSRGHLRVWIPCCKTGTLVYTIAMLLCEALANAGVEAQLQVFGTDPDERALAAARAGRYPDGAALGLEPGLRGRYMFDELESIRVSEALREACVFSRHKLTRDAPLSRMDLVVCHRVFDGVPLGKRERVLAALAFSLREGGLLLALGQDSEFAKGPFEATERGFLRVHARRAKKLTPMDQGLVAQGAPGQRLARDRAELIRAHAELARFVHFVGVPLLLCDAALRILHMSAEARAALGLSTVDHGESLAALVQRVPGGEALLQSARYALETHETQELAIRTETHAYIARVSVALHPAGSGVSIVFSDVSALEAANASAVAQQHQQAAIARVGKVALSSATQEHVFEEALAALFGSISVCAAGAILERPDEASELEVVASRGLGPDPRAALQALGAPAALLQPTIERGSAQVQSWIVGNARNLQRLTSAVSFPICNDGEIVGVIVLYARRRGIDGLEHEHFLQAMAHVLGGSIARQRTRRRLSLELEVSAALGSARDVVAMCSAVARALRAVMPLDVVEVWVPRRDAPGAWLRQFPDAAWPTEQSFSPDELREEAVRYRAPLPDTKAPAELTIRACACDTPAAIVRVLGHRLVAPDSDLRQGLERVAGMLGDFLERLAMMDALRESEASFRRTSDEYHSLYTALQRVEEDLRETDRQKDDFLAMLGHELRNPLAAIRNATDLLAPLEVTTPQVARLHGVLERQTAQMTKLIDGLLDVARVARGKVELQIALVPINELLRQVLDDRRHQLAERHVELTLPEDPLWVAADRVRLIQIVDNLLSNAQKFTSPGGHIAVELRHEGGLATLTVKDDGMGIDADVFPKIFEPFRQGRSALAQGGLGLGLALVKGLVELHGFALRVASEGPGRGASFCIDFPVVDAPESRPPESRLDLRALKLLLVEDNPDIADTLAELLVALGHEVELAASAELALDLLRTRQPEIILCDIGLPGMDGMAMATRVRQDPVLKDLKLVAMTGYGDAATRARVESAGFDRLLIKPVQLGALSQCLARVAASISR
jgi:signal transduction histidine kinase/ActR/RegA family two-component response regulator